MKYIKLNIRVNTKWQDQLIADLVSEGFSGFQQLDYMLIAFISEKDFTSSKLENLENLLKRYTFRAELDSWEYIEDRNWNEAWEQTLTPQFVGKFFIRPSWSEIESPSNTTLLQIDPKMSFGTGYHASTRLILRKMPEIVEEGDKVLDAGTGTGILAIAAVKMGAEWVFGFDIDEWSYRNASENTKLNDVEERVTLVRGDQQVIPDDTTFDVIIANINRSVILPMLPLFLERLKAEGTLVLSGLTRSDRSQIEENENLQKYASLRETTREGEWICMHYQKSSHPEQAEV